MGMQPSDDGSLRPRAGFLTSKIPQCEELVRPGMPVCEVIEFSPLLDSSDMGPSDWIKIAEIIETNFLKFDGFVVIHGTDTMAYTGSALSFMFPPTLSKPIVLVGSMLPFGEVHSDARRNLACAILIASRRDFPEVVIFFNDRLLRGNRSTKIDSQSIGAFDSPNCPPIAMMGTELAIRKDHSSWRRNCEFTSQTDNTIVVEKKLETRIIVIRLVPGFTDLESLVDPNAIRGIVLQLYGTGNAPCRKTSFITWVKKLIHQGIFVVACSQCLHGRVILEEYAVGKQLHDAGVVSALDMTTEATVAKMAHLLGQYSDDLPLVRKLFQTSLRGELSEECNNLSRLPTPRNNSQ